MIIIRKNKVKHFTQIDNSIITNTEILDSAFRLYTYLMSHSDNWVIYNKDIMIKLKWKEHTLRKAFKNLANNGFCKRYKNHVNGRWEWQTEVYEEAQKPEFNHNTILRISTDCNTTRCETPDITIKKKTKTNKRIIESYISDSELQDNSSHDPYRNLRNIIQKEINKNPSYYSLLEDEDIHSWFIHYIIYEAGENSLRSFKGQYRVLEPYTSYQIKTFKDYMSDWVVIKGKYPYKITDDFIRNALIEIDKQIDIPL